jgi:ABC-type Na+ transport system ATPase subunit NatA
MNYNFLKYFGKLYNLENKNLHTKLTKLNANMKHGI